MTSMRAAPCNWPLAYCGESMESTGGVTDASQCSSLANLAPAMSLLVQEFATTYLWNWTRRQFGTCPVVIRPCREQCNNWATYRGRGWATTNIPWFEGSPGPLNPALIGGQWYNLPCGGSCNDECSCTYVPTVELAGPVASVTQVRINGVVLASSAYRVDNFRYLVRTDGDDWPVCQNMTDDTDDLLGDTFEVTYQIGVEVPSGGQIAAGVLACEMAKAICGSNTCKLPQRIQSITRQGVQTQLLDSFDSMYRYGTTGLIVVDMWVGSVMASNRQAGTRIASPDTRSVRRTTG